MFKLTNEQVALVMLYCGVDKKTVEIIESEVNYLAKDKIANIEDYIELVMSIASECVTSELINEENNKISYAFNGDDVLKTIILERVFNIASYKEVKAMSLKEIILKELDRKYNDNFEDELSGFSIIKHL